MPIKTICAERSSLTIPGLSLIMVLLLVACQERREGSGVTGVRITSTVTEVQVGASIIMKAVVAGGSTPGRGVVWSSGDPDIAIVAPQTGVVTGETEGSVASTVTSARGYHKECRCYLPLHRTDHPAGLE